MKEQNFNFNLKSAKDPETEQLVYVFTSVKGTRIKVSTKHKVLVKCWDTKSQRCVTSSLFAKELNANNKRINKFLDKLLDRLTEVYSINNNFMYHTDKKIPKIRIELEIKYLLNGEKEEVKKQNIKPLEYFEEYVKVMDKRIISVTNTYIAPRTIQHHQIVLKRFQQFFEDNNIKNNFSVFDKIFAQRFEIWAYSVKNYRSNTIPASFSVLKVWLNEANREGLITDLTYKDYKSKPSPVDTIYLNKNEVDLIYKLDIPTLVQEGKIDPKSRCEITRDLFIVGCWTGLRFSDLSNINDGNINLESNTLTLIAQKTKQKVVIPLHPYVVEIYNKYNGKFPRASDKTRSIAHLRHLGMLAEINEPVLIKGNKGGKITSTTYPKYQLIMNHTARRTFATNLYLMGAPTISIMQLTGHTTEANFLKYIKVTKEENADLMRKFFQ